MGNRSSKEDVRKLRLEKVRMEKLMIEEQKKMNQTTDVQDSNISGRKVVVEK